MRKRTDVGPDIDAAEPAWGLGSLSSKIPPTGIWRTRDDPLQPTQTASDHLGPLDHRGNRGRVRERAAGYATGVSPKQSAAPKTGRPRFHRHANASWPAVSRARRRAAASARRDAWREPRRAAIRCHRAFRRQEPREVVERQQPGPATRTEVGGARRLLRGDAEDRARSSRARASAMCSCTSSGRRRRKLPPTVRDAGTAA